MKLHIFVATTQGLVAIQNISEINDADISSIVSINGTSTTANISSAYHNFVKKGAGIIQQDFGACSYRININRRIDQGNSWQLAFYLAHVAKSENRLGDGQVNIGDRVICATGEVNTTSRDIQSVNSISRKQTMAAEQIKQWHRNKIQVSFLIPKSNAQDINKKLPLNIKLVENLTQALNFLSSPSVENTINASKNKGLFWRGNSKRRGLFFSLFIITLVALISLVNLNDLQVSESATQEKNSLEIDSLESHSSDESLRSKQAWQIVILNKPLDEINTSLQSTYSLIEKTITEQLIINHFDVADKTLITGNTTTTELPLPQWINRGFNLALRFDFTINKLAQQTKRGNENTVSWHYELSATLTDLATNKKIDTHTEQGEFSKQLTRCDTACFDNWHASNARKLAQDMGAILVIKLNNLPRRYQFELAFEDFLSHELVLIQNQLEEITGYLNHNLLQEFDLKQQLLHQTSSRKYLYSSYLSADELTQQLTSTLAKGGLFVTPYKKSTSTLVFKRNSTPYLFYYLFSLLLLLCLFLSLFAFLFMAKRRWRMTLASRNQLDEHILQLTTGLQESKGSGNNEYMATLPEGTAPIQGTVIGSGALENCTIFTSKTVALGRCTTTTTSSFAIGYQQLSHADKQCLFSYENNHFYIEDQGSTNGSVFNNILLPAHKKIAILQDSTLVLGGVNHADIGLCQLDITLDKHHSSALVMQLNANKHQLFECNNAPEAWTSMHKDLLSCWVFLKNEVSLSIEDDRIKFGSDKSEIVALLVYQQGFYIKPLSIEDGINNKPIVMINNEVIHSIRPINKGAVISLNGYEFSLRGL